MNNKSIFPLIALTAILIMLISVVASAQPGPRDGGPPFDRGEPLPPGLDPNFTPPGRNPDFTPPGQTEPPAQGDDDQDEEDSNGPPFCRGPVGGGPDGQAGLSSIAHLDFSQAEAGDEASPAWGRMMYRWIAPVFDFVFNAHALPPGSEYTLTYQPQPLPAPGVICLGDGTVNEDGDLHIQNALDIATDLPASHDENEERATLALVPSVDVDCDTGEMLIWQAEDYLFGDEEMFYVHSELDDEEEEDDD